MMKRISMETTTMMMKKIKSKNTKNQNKDQLGAAEAAEVKRTNNLYTDVKMSKTRRLKKMKHLQ